MKTNPYRNGFTKWDFLVIVIVLAFLAFIAKNQTMYEPQPRAKIARAKADFRSISNALNTYKSDNGIWPSDLSLLKDSNTNNPIYSTDPFSKDRKEYYRYIVFEEGQNYILISRGGNGKFDRDYTAGMIPNLNLKALTYDPSNGTVSAGDIFRLSGD